MNGRLIYFYGLPSIVRPQTSTPWEIMIFPDYSEMDKDKWWKEYDKRSNPERQFEEEADSLFDDDSRYDGYINWGEALSDQHIRWFREKKPSTRSVLTEKVSN